MCAGLERSVHGTASLLFQGTWRDRLWHQEFKISRWLRRKSRRMRWY